MELPNIINLIELIIAVILILNFIGNFPPVLVTILGVILLIDVLRDILAG